MKMLASFSSPAQPFFHVQKEAKVEKQEKGILIRLMGFAQYRGNLEECGVIRHKRQGKKNDKELQFSYQYLENENLSSS